MRRDEEHKDEKAREELGTMATFAKCTDEKGRTLWVNLDNATTMQWRDTPSPGNEIIFVGGALVVVRERPEQLAKQA
ncbi:MAG TPA: hypothetical protein VKW08_05580 [Xanthobacteraceae bacterium]|nr:hypothetical protein [Xanthobacteraceae bacterium]